MKIKKCKICYGKLKGKQRKFCSQKCMNKYHYLKHRNKQIKRVVEWKKKNPEKFNNYIKQYYKKHRKKILENSKEWYKLKDCKRFKNKVYDKILKELK